MIVQILIESQLTQSQLTQSQVFQISRLKSD